MQDLYYISLIHDIGKICFSDALLLKPGPLSVEEFEVVSVDAMYSTRPYRKRQSIDLIKKELEQGKEKQFDPEEV